MTGPKLVQDFGMEWVYTDMPQHKGKRFGKVMRKLKDHCNINYPESYEYSQIGQKDGEWITSAIEKYNIDHIDFMGLWEKLPGPSKASIAAGSPPPFPMYYGDTDRKVGGCLWAHFSDAGTARWHAK